MSFHCQCVINETLVNNEVLSTVYYTADAKVGIVWYRNISFHCFGYARAFHLRITAAFN